MSICAVYISSVYHISLPIYLSMCLYKCRKRLLRRAKNIKRASSSLSGTCHTRIDCPHAQYFPFAIYAAHQPHKLTQCMSRRHESSTLSLSLSLCVCVCVCFRAHRAKMTDVDTTEEAELSYGDDGSDDDASPHDDMY